MMPKSTMPGAWSDQASPDTPPEKKRVGFAPTIKNFSPYDKKSAGAIRKSDAVRRFAGAKQQPIVTSGKAGVRRDALAARGVGQIMDRAAKAGNIVRRTAPPAGHMPGAKPPSDNTANRKMGVVPKMRFTSPKAGQRIPFVSPRKEGLGKIDRPSVVAKRAWQAARAANDLQDRPPAPEGRVGKQRGPSLKPPGVPPPGKRLSSTGTHPAGGATVDDVALLVKHAGRLKVKAAGGIRDAPNALAMLDAGAQRLGTSAGPAIISQLGQTPV